MALGIKAPSFNAFVVGASIIRTLLITIRFVSFEKSSVPVITMKDVYM